MPRTAEIIAVGSELLTGGVTNTNARFLSELLTAAGYLWCLILYKLQISRRL